MRRRLSIYREFLFACLTLLTTVAWAQPQTSYRIDTFAGGGLGDGGPASQARLYFPYGVAMNRTGNLYIADTGNHRLRKVDSTGTITTFAGTGEYGFSGDGGPATQGHFYSLFGVAVAGAGNLYIADTGNHRIRLLTPTATGSSLVLVNVATHPIRPALYFYDKGGNPIAAESVVDALGDLEITGNGALIVQTEMEPLGELTISTHGRGVVVTGSVKVVADGAIGGVLRFDLPP